MFWPLTGQRGWRGYARGEQRLSAVLVAKGIPVAVAVALVGVVKLAVLGVLLYVAFWTALLLAFAMAAAWTAEHSNFQEEDDSMNRKAVLPLGHAVHSIDMVRLVVTFN